MYDSLDDALFYAAQQAREVTQDKREAMTLVYETPEGKFQFVDPAGSGGKAEVTGTRLAYPKGAKPRALLHNHPGGDQSGRDMFSAEDAALAQKLNLPSYITYGSDMRIQGLQPDGPRDKRPGGLVQGQMFDHIPEIKVTAPYLGLQKELANQLRTARTNGN
jgi:hypothetical protein